MEIKITAKDLASAFYDKMHEVENVLQGNTIHKPDEEERARLVQQRDFLERVGDSLYI